MNQEVPQPATATRSPRAGSTPARSAASLPTRRQQAGCEATSRSVRAARGHVLLHYWGILAHHLFPLLSPGIRSLPAFRSRVSMDAHVPASPVAATDRMK